MTTNQHNLMLWFAGAAIGATRQWWLLSMVTVWIYFARVE
jgi:hypothetical protein